MNTVTVAYRRADGQTRKATFDEYIPHYEDDFFVASGSYTLTNLNMCANIAKYSPSTLVIRGAGSINGVRYL